jgi:signal peptidase I
MTFPTRGPFEDENQADPSAPPPTLRWGSEADYDGQGDPENPHRFDDGYPAYANGTEGDFAFEPQPVPRPANLGNNLLLLLTGIGCIVIGLLISAGSLALFGSDNELLWMGLVGIGVVQIGAGVVQGFRGIQQSDSPRREWKRVGRATMELTQTLILAILIFLAVRAMAQNFRVEGASMEPGLHNGQYLLVNKAIYFKLNLETLDKYLPFIDPGDNPERFIFHGPKRGEVIVFEYPEDRSRDFIKRVIGIPGDRVRVEDGEVYINDELLQDDSYVNAENRSNMAERVVPAGEYFVLGDNRGNSSDSRSWGFVPEDHIIGRAMFTYWPDLGGVGNRSLDLGILKLPLP